MTSPTTTDPLPLVIDLRRELNPGFTPENGAPLFLLMVRARRGDVVVFDRPDQRVRGRSAADPLWSDGQRDVQAMFKPYDPSDCGCG